MFWSERFWLPRGVSWNDLKSNGTVHYPDIWELSYAMKEPLAIRIKAHLNFCHTGKGKFKRVAETAWRFLFYTCIWLYGFYVLSDQPQLYAVTECWRNWPHHPLTSAVWWYYVIETSFYCSLIVSSLVFDVRRADFAQMTLHHVITITLLFLSFAMNMIRVGTLILFSHDIADVFLSLVFDVRRADFAQMTLHHVITITLLFLSFAMNMIRVGTLILFSHDIADVFLELGKLCRYAGWETALTYVFATFMFVWITTRLVYFPFAIIRSVLFDAPALIQVGFLLKKKTMVLVTVLVILTMQFLFLMLFGAVFLCIFCINATQKCMLSRNCVCMRVCVYVCACVPNFHLEIHKSYKVET
ncbi:unnamed protein product [Gongylonema pulchrum]|uniref:TLC domain-containing protein n=1 Tax=Gongylonema pulchrum TaxID=637853 RepID=A0A183E5A3_9BILA|nr:unnamed protein product [Gongylonema pulchrum]